MRRQTPHCGVIAAIACLLLPLSPASSATIAIRSGHADVAVRYADGTLTFESRAGSPSSAFAPAEVVHVVSVASQENRRSPEVYDPLGVAAGGPFYKLPQGSFEATLEAAPFLGLSAEGIASGVFAGNLLRFSLIAVEGPGHFSLWRETSGGPGFESRPGFVGIPIASSDGIDANDFVDLPVGLHEHVNWGFSAPGRYDVTFSATGELIGGGVLSAHGTFRFEVDVPLHSTDLNGDGVTDRRDLVAFVSAYGTGGIEGSADFTGDGLVGIADLVALRAALVSPNETVAVAVPEPSGITSAIVGAIAFLFKRRKSRPIDSCN